jgi:hypothetical protein
MLVAGLLAKGDEPGETCAEGRVAGAADVPSAAAGAGCGEVR